MVQKNSSYWFQAKINNDKWGWIDADASQVSVPIMKPKSSIGI